MKHLEKKRTYAKPEVTKVVIDNQISMVMMTDPEPPLDPGYNIQDINSNPYKISKA
ncbi:MAG: hypothetical protein BWY22_02433 [Bacteroidetes bacterium ADurb.Bin217]|nr:MAG: hypothetical protein BWY22_02433 [Bacteroidetes bacterium ADurb.Bin217]